MFACCDIEYVILYIYRASCDECTCTRVSLYISVCQNRNARYETSINRSSEVDEELDRYVVNRDLHFFIAWLLAVGRDIVGVDDSR